MKRGRVDGQISKQEYEMGSQESHSPGTFLRATPGTLANRRMLVPKVSNKKKEFVKHIKELNRSFYDYFRECVEEDPNQHMTTVVQDYIDYVSQLEDRYLRSYGEVMTFGSGDCGQLAHGVEEDDDLMVKFPRIVYSLRNKKVVGIACGGLHNAVFTEDGQVYTWGCADDGSLGREGDENMPILVEGLAHETIIGVACGDGQTLAVAVSGDVYGWGCYKDKEGKKWFNPQPGSSAIRRQQNEPLKIQGFASDCQVVEIACGSTFNVARCANGTIYSWGLGECGELGRSVPAMKSDGEYDEASILRMHITPGKMFLTANNTKEAVNPKAIGCGAYHTLVVIGNSVYVCGLNNYGQLGIGSTESSDFLTEVEDLRGLGVVAVKGGMHHSLVLTSNGVMFSFGRGDSGQLGVAGYADGAAGDFADRPQEIVLPALAGSDTKVAAISCGANHNLAVLKNNKDVFSWGYGDMLALGHGKERDETTPKRLNFEKVVSGGGMVEKVVQVDGGGQHSAIIAVVRTT